MNIPSEKDAVSWVISWHLHGAEELTTVIKDVSLRRSVLQRIVAATLFSNHFLTFYKLTQVLRMNFYTFAPEQRGKHSISQRGTGRSTSTLSFCDFACSSACVS